MRLFESLSFPALVISYLSTITTVESTSIESLTLHGVWSRHLCLTNFSLVRKKFFIRYSDGVFKLSRSFALTSLLKTYHPSALCCLSWRSTFHFVPCSEHKDQRHAHESLYRRKSRVIQHIVCNKRIYTATLLTQDRTALYKHSVTFCKYSVR